MSEFIVTSILAECRKNWKHNLAPESRAFALGASIKICSRVAEMIRDAKPEGSNCTSVALVNLYKTELDANLEFLKSLGIDLKAGKGRQSRNVNMDAFNKGQNYGSTVGLNVQVANRNNVRIK